MFLTADTQYIVKHIAFKTLQAHNMFYTVLGTGSLKNICTHGVLELWMPERCTFTICSILRSTRHRKTQRKKVATMTPKIASVMLKTPTSMLKAATFKLKAAAVDRYLSAEELTL